MGVTRDPPSSHPTLSAIRAVRLVDLTMTQVVGENLVKVMAWYDNEWGYAAQMVREAVRQGNRG